MTTLKVTKMQYDDFLYPSVATDTDDTQQQLRLTNKVLDKLEEVGKPPAMENGLPVSGTPFYVLNDLHAEFQFEPREAAHILKKLEKSIPSLQAWRARQMLPLLDQLVETKQV